MPGGPASDNPALGACGERSSARASLVLAALAHAEGDSPHAIELLSGSGIGRSPSTIAYARDLARRLDIVAQHAAMEQIWRSGTDQTAGIRGRDTAMRTLRGEVARRSWT